MYVAICAAIALPSRGQSYLMVGGIFFCIKTSDATKFPSEQTKLFRPFFCNKLFASLAAFPKMSSPGSLFTDDFRAKYLFQVSVSELKWQSVKIDVVVNYPSSLPIPCFWRWRAWRTLAARSWCSLTPRPPAPPPPSLHPHSSWQSPRAISRDSHTSGDCRPAGSLSNVGVLWPPSSRPRRSHCHCCHPRSGTRGRRIGG